MAKKHIDTILAHNQKLGGEKFESTTLPVYQTTSFRYRDCETLSKVFNGGEPGYIYSRISNPTLTMMEQKLAILEGGLGALVTSSGMAAIAVAVMTLAKNGHHIVCGNSVFGGTYSFFKKTIKEFGIETTFVDPSIPEEYERGIRPETKVLFLETIGNPKLDVPDIESISAIAKKYGVPLVVDSTATTPILVNPGTMGADIVIHSTSKFIAGHGSSIGGVIIDAGSFNWEGNRFPHFKEYAEKYGTMAFLAKARKEVFRDFGPCLSPQNAYILSLGLETLSLRMERHCANALKLAGYLEKHSKVSEVRYPGLGNGKYYEIVKKQFNGLGGALLTFKLKSREECFKFIDSLELAGNLANLGDSKTLVIHPASTICIEFDDSERNSMGVTDELVRVSVGIEYIDDIIEDFSKALDKV